MNENAFLIAFTKEQKRSTETVRKKKQYSKCQLGKILRLVHGRTNCKTQSHKNFFFLVKSMILKNVKNKSNI